MASNHQDTEKQFKYDLIKRVWMGRLGDSGLRRVGDQYFGNLIQEYPNFSFSFVERFDGTTQAMVDNNQYQQMKRDLEKQTRISLPDITHTDMRDFRILESRKTFPNRRAFINKLKAVNQQNENVRSRAFKKAAEHTNKVRHFISSNHRDAKFFTYDIEVHDKDMKTILEIGFVQFTLKEEDQLEYFHAIVNDDLQNREGFNNKEKFKFGTSQRMSLREATGRLQRGIEDADAVVVHAGHHDEQYLEDNRIRIAEKITFDTQVLALNLLPKNKYRLCWGLKKILEEMKISHDEDILHNAGNDAHYTMMAFKALVKK